MSPDPGLYCADMIRWKLLTFTCLFLLLGEGVAACPAGCECDMGWVRNKLMVHCYMTDYTTIGSIMREAPGMAYLIVSKSPLTEMTKATIPLNSQIVHLEVTSTQLSEIEVGALKKLPNLKTLRLSDNKLERFDSSVFADLQLNTLILSGNNGISLNNVDELQTTILALNDCGIISFDDLPPNAHFTELQIANNKITHISPRHLGLFLKLMTVNLAGNPLHCDEELGWLLHMSDTRQILLVDSDDTICATPRELEGQIFSRLSYSQLGYQPPASTTSTTTLTPITIVSKLPPTLPYFLRITTTVLLTRPPKTTTTTPTTTPTTTTTTPTTTTTTPTTTTTTTPTTTATTATTTPTTTTTATTTPKTTTTTTTTPKTTTTTTTTPKTTTTTTPKPTTTIWTTARSTNTLTSRSPRPLPRTWTPHFTFHPDLTDLSHVHSTRRLMKTSAQTRRSSTTPPTVVGDSAARSVTATTTSAKLNTLSYLLIGISCLLLLLLLPTCICLLRRACRRRQKRTYLRCAIRSADSSAEKLNKEPLLEVGVCHRVVKVPASPSNNNNNNNIDLNHTGSNGISNPPHAALRITPCAPPPLPHKPSPPLPPKPDSVVPPVKPDPPQFNTRPPNELRWDTALKMYC